MNRILLFRRGRQSLPPGVESRCKARCLHDYTRQSDFRQPGGQTLSDEHTAFAFIAACLHMACADDDVPSS